MRVKLGVEGTAGSTQTEIFHHARPRRCTRRRRELQIELAEAPTAPLERVEEIGERFEMGGAPLAHDGHVTESGRAQQIRDRLRISERERLQQLFALRGEEGFRLAETAALYEVCAQSGVVAATGGGIILKAGNIDAMKKSGTVVFIDRPVRDIEKDVDWNTRPLLAGGRKALYRLYRERIRLYRAACDLVLPAAGTPQDTARALIRLLKR
jgi:shikimate kinase